MSKVIFESLTRFQSLKSKFLALHEELEAIDAIKVTAPEELKYMFKDVTVGRDPLVDDKDSNKEMR